MTTAFTFTLKAGYEHRFARALHRFLKREGIEEAPDGFLVGILLGIVVGTIAHRCGGDRQRTLGEIQTICEQAFDYVFRQKTDA